MNKNIQKLINERNNLLKENKILKDKIKTLELENKFIKEENVDKLEKLEKYVENFYKKNLIVEQKNISDSCFKLPYIFIRFHKRNIPLRLNLKRSFGTTYTYSGFFENYNIGLSSETFKEKQCAKFSFSVFFYFNKKDNNLYVSAEGQVKEKNDFVKYLFYTKNNNKEFQKYKYIECETFGWPFLHTVSLKNNDLNEIDEFKIKIMKSNNKS